MKTNPVIVLDSLHLDYLSWWELEKKSNHQDIANLRINYPSCPAVTKTSDWLGFHLIHLIGAIWTIPLTINSHPNYSNQLKKHFHASRQLKFLIDQVEQFLRLQIVIEWASWALRMGLCHSVDPDYRVKCFQIHRLRAIHHQQLKNG